MGRLRDDIHGRVYSDDTVCSDLKMSAYAAVQLDPGLSLARQYLQKLLQWCYTDPTCKHTNALFQGTGGFTRAYLSLKHSKPLREASSRRPLCDNAFEPTDWYFEWVQQLWSGLGPEPASFGNGAVMCAAMAGVARALWDERTQV